MNTTYSRFDGWRRMVFNDIKLWHPRLIRSLPNFLIRSLYKNVSQVCVLLEVVDEDAFIAEWESGKAARTAINHILYHVLKTESTDWKNYIYAVDDLFQSRIKGKELKLGDPERNKEMNKVWDGIKRVWENRAELVRTATITERQNCDCMKHYFTDRAFVRDVFALQGLHEQGALTDEDWQKVVNVVKSSPISEDIFERTLMAWEKELE